MMEQLTIKRKNVELVASVRLVVNRIGPGNLVKISMESLQNGEVIQEFNDITLFEGDIVNLGPLSTLSMTMGGG